MENVHCKVYFILVYITFKLRFMLIYAKSVRPRKLRVYFSIENSGKNIRPAKLYVYLVFYNVYVTVIGSIYSCYRVFTGSPKIHYYDQCRSVSLIILWISNPLYIKISVYVSCIKNFVYVSCFIILRSCMYRYTRNTIQETRRFLVPCSDL